MFDNSEMKSEKMLDDWPPIEVVSGTPYSVDDEITPIDTAPSNITTEVIFEYLKSEILRAKERDIQVCCPLGTFSEVDIIRHLQELVKNSVDHPATFKSKRTGNEELIRFCPECGSGDVDWCNISHRPHCNECRHWGPMNLGSDGDAIRNWNKRVSQPWNY
jgi:hypothetical protein